MEYELNNEHVEEIRIALYNQGLSLQEMKANTHSISELNSLEKAENTIAEVLYRLRDRESELPFA